MNKSFRFSFFVVAALLLLPAAHVNAQEAAETAHAHAPKQETAAQREARMAWWKEARFGMFVHWGIYSTTGGLYKGKKLPNSAEWMMCRGKIPIAEYEQYAAQFNPLKFEAAEFVGRAKRAGMKYIVITAKHHDGFAMFDSAAGDYNVVDKTPFARDIMKELADECLKQDIKFGFYYSQAQDWHHPGGFGNSWDKTLKKVSSDDYVMNKAVPEVKQLLTDYGPIGIFWWDTPRKMSKESFDALHSLTGLQKNTITNDRLGDEYPGDYKTFERHIPQQAPAGKDWEVCMPISGSWGYKIGDESWKSTGTLIRNLVTIASMGGNYLLNVSPTGEGTLLPPALERLEQIGTWMDVNGESIYGSSAGPLASLEWGKSTMKQAGENTTLYLHVFDWPTDGKLMVPGLKNSVRAAKLLDGGQALNVVSSETGVEIALPSKASNPHASVIVLDLAGKVEVEAQLPSFNSEGKLLLTADKAYINNNEGSKDAALKEHDGTPHIGYWHDKEASVEWQFTAKEAGEYAVLAELSVEPAATKFEVSVEGGSTLAAEVKSTKGYGNYKKFELGTLQITKPGEQILRVKPAADSWHPINLRWVELKKKN